jgi:hypothetical protein
LCDQGRCACALTDESMLCYNLHAEQGQMLRSVGCLQSVWAVGLSCCPCCPFPPGISIYRVERGDAGDLVDSKNRQQTCGFGANRMKSKKGT